MSITMPMIACAILCDGCQCGVRMEEIKLINEDGRQVRYCGDCATVWKNFETAQQAEGARLQRLLELWTIERRKALHLGLTPLDLPPLARDRGGRQVILG